jgi:hypothetical protein
MEARTVTTREAGEVTEVLLDGEVIGSIIQTEDGYENAYGGDFEYQTIDEAIEDLLIDHDYFEEAE